MVETLGEQTTKSREHEVFNADNLIRVECYSNEYAAELREEMVKRGVKTILTDNPRLVIGVREA